MSYRNFNQARSFYRSAVVALALATLAAASGCADAGRSQGRGESPESSQRALSAEHCTVELINESGAELSWYLYSSAGLDPSLSLNGDGLADGSRLVLETTAGESVAAGAYSDEMDWYIEEQLCPLGELVTLRFNEANGQSMDNLGDDDDDGWGDDDDDGWADDDDDLWGDDDDDDDFR